MKRLVTSVALSAFAALPANAFDLSDLSADDRAAFREEVRAYLLENPEILMEAIAVLEQRQAENQANADQALAAANAQSLFNDEYSWVGGNPDGDITIVEFVDYRCGYCRRAHPEIAELINTDGNIRIIIKEFPILGEQSLMASQFAIATKLVEGHDAYKDITDALIELRSNVTQESLAQLSDAFGLRTEEILAKMSDDAVANEIAANRALGQRMQISGTPTFVIEDQLLRGYLPLDDMRQLVAEVRNAS